MMGKFIHNPDFTKGEKLGTCANCAGSLDIYLKLKPFTHHFYTELEMTYPQKIKMGLALLYSAGELSFSGITEW